MRIFRSPLRASRRASRAPRPAPRASRLATRNSQLATRNSRRGVLLLVVLSLLVLFLMIGTAFIITAKQSQLAAKSAVKASLNAARLGGQGELLNEVVLQLVRDTENPYSVVRHHSLLGDMYGNDGFFAEVGRGDLEPNTGMKWAASATTANDNVTGGQMVQFQLNLAADLNPQVAGNQSIVDLYKQPVQLSGLDGAYNGQVLTFIGRGTGANGRSARGVSTRIVGYRPTGINQGVFTVMAFALADGSDLSTLGVDLSALDGSRILVNGRPFNGTGVGLDLTHPPTYTGPRLDAKELVGGALKEIALMPNSVFLNPQNVRLSAPNVLSYFPNGVDVPTAYNPLMDYTGRGGADESYDAADFQNMALAFVPDPAEETRVAHDGTLDDTILPSFHRPALINYWNNQTAPGRGPGSDASQSPPLAMNPVMLRKVLLRPTWFDHPNFTGSNTELTPLINTLKKGGGNVQQASAALVEQMIYGPWDVDNDNDGLRDSVWIDVGLPVMVGPNGKLVKPLAAVLCIDLDGRANVNVHGSLDLAGVIDDVREEVPLAGGEESDDTPRGMGWGVADISLEEVLGDDFQRLLVGDTLGGPGGPYVPGRYGVDRGPGRSGMYDQLSQISFFAWPQWGNQPRTGFASPPDLRARYGNGVNAFGQLVIEATLPSEVNRVPDQFGQVARDGRLVADSPYEAVIFPEGADGYNGLLSPDAPFSVAELERVLRVYDADAGTLPGRLGFLSGVTVNSSGLEDRLRITTDSWDVPSPNVALPHEMEPLLAAQQTTAGQPPRRLPRSTAELFEMRVRKALNLPLFPLPIGDDPSSVDPQSPSQAGRVRLVLRQILAPELAAGLRLDINRPFGNGQDDNNNGVVDEPLEETTATPTQVWRPNTDGVNAVPLPPTFAGAAFRPLDANDDGEIDDLDGPLQRQLLARHLYCLALALTAEADFGSTTPPTAAEQALCRRLAQWAVNVVDFRDPDNIMTPFEYDLNPFDGWNTAGGEPIDGDLRTTADHVGPDGLSDPAANSQIDDTYVWGCERPELVITETLAWHDRRTQDSISEDPYPPSDVAGPTDPNDRDFDPDYDQVVRPRGAFFLELYNPWAASPGASADTHAIAVRGGQALDFGVNLQAVDSLTGNSPVWRLAIYKRRTIQGNPIAIGEAALWDPDERDTTRNRLHRPNVPMDRSVYFTPFEPEMRNQVWDDDGVAYFGRSQNIATVRPGRYMVVGSGDDFDNDGVYESPIGDRISANNDQPANQLPRGRRMVLDTTNSQYKVRLMDNAAGEIDDPAGFAVVSPAEASAQATNVLEPLPGDTTASVADVAVIDQVYDVADNYDDWQGAVPGSGERQQRRRRFTISEPARGYITRFRDARWSDTDQRYRNPQSQSRAIDIPLDGPIGGEEVLENRVDDNGESVWTDNFPIPAYLNNIDPALVTVGQLSNSGDDPRISYAFIYLQRLANPTLPWNPPPAPGANPSANGHNPNLQVNPYLTVDGASSDLTVFNGRPQSPPASPHGYEEDKLTSENGVGTDTNLARMTFSSLERGFSGAAGNQLPNVMPPLWTWQRPSRSMGPRAPVVPQNRYRTMLSSTHVFRAPPYCSLGFLNSAYQNPNAPDPARRQLLPREPFPWITWNNRPYVSGNELLIVPRVRSSTLMREFSTAEIGEQAAGGIGSPYDTPAGVPLAANAAAPGQQTDVVAYPHLENYFYDEEPNPQAPGAGLAAGVGQPLHLYRVLEYIHTPSAFAGSQTWLNPLSFNGQTANSATASLEDPRMNLGPPFNTMSQFREPGRINLNTIASEDVWNSLFHGEPSPDEEESHAGPDWDDFFESRRGYGGGDLLTLDATWPTFFGNPFRSPDAAALVPLANMMQRNGPQGAPMGVECTLLRSDDSQASEVDDDPLFAAQTNDPHNNAERNAFFHFAPMMRLDNLVTTRSNVYAVWVTIGFFEVETAPLKAQFGSTNNVSGAELDALYARVYPDGYAFGKEAGLDEGDVRRLRGFYIIDRTRPAGYEPGADHNVDEVIRLRRRIE